MSQSPRCHPCFFRSLQRKSHQHFFFKYIMLPNSGVKLPNSGVEIPFIFASTLRQWSWLLQLMDEMEIFPDVITMNTLASVTKLPKEVEGHHLAIFFTPIPNGLKKTQPLIFVNTLWHIVAWFCRLKNVCCLDVEVVCLKHEPCTTIWKDWTLEVLKCLHHSPWNQHSPWKWIVGRLVSFWGPAYFHGRTVGFREGKSKRSLCISEPWRHPCALKTHKSSFVCRSPPPPRNTAKGSFFGGILTPKDCILILVAIGILEGGYIHTSTWWLPDCSSNTKSIIEQWKQKNGYSGNIGDYTTQLKRDHNNLL